MFIDIHTHNPDYEENVIKIINIFNETQLINENFQYVSIGLHPWNIKNDNSEHLQYIKKTSLLKQVFAIGEAGLDRAVDIDYKLQKDIFIAQAHIAQNTSKPMIIHAVRSYYDIISNRKLFAVAPPWIIHGFNANEKTAIELVKHNFYLSFGKSLHNKKTEFQILFNKIPPSCILFETDDSGASILSIYEKASQLLKIPLDKLKLLIYRNFQKLLFL